MTTDAEPQKVTKTSPRLTFTIAVVVILLVNIITLGIILSGIVVPYVHLISFFRSDEEEYYTGFTDEYCVYLEGGQATFTWQFDTDVEANEKYMYGYVTYWYEAFDDELPMGYYIWGWKNGTSQTFYGWNSTNDETKEVFVEFSESGDMIGFQPAPVNTDGIYMDIDYGYSEITELLYRSLYVSRPFETKYEEEFSFNMDEFGSNMLWVFEYEDPYRTSGTPDYYNSIDVFLQDQVDVCVWNSRLTRRTTLVRKLFQETGYNLNAFLTLNYLVLLILFRKMQPTKSRLPLLPLNAATVFLISTAAIIINVIMHGLYYGAGNGELTEDQETRLDKVADGSLVATSIQQIMAAFCMLIYSLHIARYYYLKNLYSWISRKEKIGPKDFVIHRRLTSNFAFAIYASIILTVILAVFIPIVATQNISQYNPSGQTIISSFVYAIRTIVLLIIAGCFTVDIAMNLKELIAKRSKAFWWFFSSGDPLYFRFEMLLFSAIHFIIHPAYIMQMNIRYQRNRPFIIDPFAPMFTRTGLASEILYQVYNNFYLNFLICGGSICLIQLYCLFRDRRRGSNVEEEVSEVEKALDDKDGFKIMKAYCEKEWSTENLLCWQYLWEFKNSGTASAATISEIYESFIKRGSNMEVNIPNKTRKGLAEVLGPNGENIKDQLPFTHFHDLYTQVITNLSDTFSRVKFTEEYEQFLLKFELVNKQYL